MDREESDVGHWPDRWSTIAGERAVTQINVLDGELGRGVRDSENYYDGKQE